MNHTYYIVAAVMTGIGVIEFSYGLNKLLDGCSELFDVMEGRDPDIYKNSLEDFLKKDK